MENWGLITGRTSVYLYDPKTSGLAAKKRTVGVQSHEVSHQWFGNIVTMEWWEQVRDAALDSADDAALAQRGVRDARRRDHHRRPHLPRVEDALQLHRRAPQARPRPRRAPVVAPDRGPLPRFGHDQPDLRRHQLQQGRLGAQDAVQHGRRGDVPQGRVDLPQGAPLRQRDDQGPLGRHLRGLGPRRRQDHGQLDAQGAPIGSGSG